ncbi:Uncharacterized protein TPAR_05620 [Tolypocladium paradoxum]|uniref:Uncharacterized protein n=1 Tax=Tolypocladium paradoxum TaxID=94208 RepID=A0A2S4KVI6_9HYPO|nr:Uncharacterized protein TPAR_05620 [Tolypocladium paradoxum]
MKVVSKADQVPSPSSNSDVSEDQLELSRILKGFKHDLTFNGIWSLAEDGVLRSLTADRDVVDAIALPPRLIKAMLDRMPFDPQNEVKYRGVDGTTVPREQWFHPDKNLLPPPLVLTDEQRREAETKVEENKKMVEEWEKRSIGVPYVMSDHDLGLKGAAPGDGEESV